MSSTNAPFGLRPVKHPTGLVRPYQLSGGVASGYSTTLYQGQAVKMTSSGTIEAAAVSEDFVGCFQGVQYTDSATDKRIISNRWPASATYVAGSMVATFTRDPGIIYAVQADGAVAQTAIGAQFNLSAFTSGNTTTGLSATTMSATETVSEGQVAVVDLAPFADNAWSDSYTVVYVRISRHQDVANKVPY